MALPPLLTQLWQESERGTLFNVFILSIVLLFSLLILLLKPTPRGSKLQLPPSPPKLPIIGNLHQLGTLPHRSFQALSKKYGPLMLLHLGSAPTLVVSSAEMAREIMNTHDRNFANRVQGKGPHTVFYGCRDVAFCSYGNYWREVRKICVVELLSVKRVQSFQFVREEEAADLIEKIRRASLDGASINLSEMLVNLSNNVISKVTLGQKYFGGGEVKKSFGELARKAVELFGDFCFQDLFPYLWWMDVLTGFDASLKETSEGLHTFLDRVIDEHKTSNNDEDQYSDKKDFVDILLGLQKEGMLDINLTQDNLKAILMDMFVAGTETTAGSMEWAMAELMKSPTTMRKAQEEVRRVVGKKSKIEEADINKMDYLKCIIKETLRLHPPGPFLVPRESIASATLGGYHIPPKTRVFINAFAIQRDPKSWERPEEFLPERFENNPVDYKGQDFQFIPFGAGRRGCPGITFGMVEAEHVLANLLYWFDWELPGGAAGEDLDMTEVYGIAVHKKTPLHLVPLLHSQFVKESNSPK